jgi:hypothetical protein
MPKKAKQGISKQENSLKLIKWEEKKPESSFKEAISPRI